MKNLFILSLIFVLFSCSKEDNGYETDALYVGNHNGINYLISLDSGLNILAYDGFDTALTEEGIKRSGDYQVIRLRFPNMTGQRPKTNVILMGVSAETADVDTNFFTSTKVGTTYAEVDYELLPISILQCSVSYCEY